MFKYAFFVVFFLVFNFGCGPADLAGGNGSTRASGQRDSDENNENFGLVLDQENALNLAVSPGGGLNAYTSLYLAKKFGDAADAHIRDLFHIFWGLSGGTIAATMMMSEHKTMDGILKDFEEETKTAFPSLDKITHDVMQNYKKIGTIASDSEGKRRNAFKQALEKNLGALKFTGGIKNRFVLVASAGGFPGLNGKPVCYADGGIFLPSTCAYKFNQPDLPVVNGIISSSNFQISKTEIAGYLGRSDYGALARVLTPLIPDNGATLFKKETYSTGQGQDVELIDGAFADKKYLDGVSPLPLAVDYLLGIKPKDGKAHNLVVFDNGAASIARLSNQTYRDEIGLGADGKAAILGQNGVKINVYMLKINISQDKFDTWTYTADDAHWNETRTLVDRQLNNGLKTVFNQAVTAVKTLLN